MANDVTIVVEASLGDTLIKLDLAKHAISSLGNQAEESAAQQDAAALSTVGFADSLGFLTKNAQLGIPFLASFAVPLIALPAIAFAAVAAIVALADTIGTLTAIVADAVAPFTLVLALLGGLGAAFAYVAVQSFKNKATLQDQRDALLALHVAQQTYNEDLKKYGANATQTENALLALHKAQDAYSQAQLGVAIHTAALGDKFHELIKTLSVDFAPLLIRLVGGLSIFVSYLDRVAKMPLAEAFKSLSTKGVQYINEFVNAIAKVVARPIQLAFKFAFGAGPTGNEFASAVASWWHRFTDFLFGYTQNKVVKVGGKIIPTMGPTQVDGIFKPLQDWFNRHHFTKQGIQIGHDILYGILNSGMAKRLAQFFLTVLVDSAKLAWQAVLALTRQVGNDMTHALIMDAEITWKRIGQIAGDVWGAIKTAADAVIGFIRDHLGNVKTAILALAILFAGPVVAGAEAVVSVIGDIISAIQTAVGWAQTLADALNASPTSRGAPPGSTGPPSRGGGGRGNPHGNVMGAGVVIHLHNPSFSDPASQRRATAQLADAVSRRWLQSVGGS